MTAAYQAISSVANAGQSTTSITLLEPAGSVAGDMLVAIIAYRSNVQWTVPSGWTKREEQNTGDTGTTSTSIASILVADIVRGASAPSLVFTRGLGEISRGVVVSIRGGGGTIVYEASSSNTLPSGGGAVTATSPSITTGGSGRVIIGGFAGVRGNNSANWSGQTCLTDPTTLTERVDISSSTSPTISLSAAAASMSGSGATGALNGTCVFSGRHAAALLSYYESSGVAAQSRSRAMVYG